MWILKELAAWDSLRKLVKEPGYVEEENGFGLTFKINITIYVYKCQANIKIYSKAGTCAPGTGRKLSGFFVGQQ